MPNPLDGREGLQVDPPHETEWWKEGFLAALDNLDRSACPHAAQSEAASWWLRGWADERNSD